MVSFQGTPARLNDPNTDSRLIVAGQGYWVFAEEPAQIEFEGDPLQAASIELAPGWNLIGCPLSSPVTIEDPQQLLSSLPVSSTLDETNASNIKPPEIQGSTPAKILPAIGVKEAAKVPIAQAGTVLEPKQAYWVYAQRQGKLSFGESSASAPSQGLGGVVMESNGTPIPRAKIQLNLAGRPTVVRTDQQGRFTLPNLETSSGMNLTASAENFHPQTVRIGSIDGAAAQRLQIKLRRYLCQITISVYSFEYGSSTYRPYQLSIWESKRYSNRTYQTFWNSTSYRNDFVWQNFPQGKEYTVQFIWQDQQGNQLFQTRRAVANKLLTQMHAYNSWTTW
jgi:hypothetical protein